MITSKNYMIRLRLLIWIWFRLTIKFYSTSNLFRWQKTALQSPKSTANIYNTNNKIENQSQHNLHNCAYQKLPIFTLKILY